MRVKVLGKYGPYPKNGGATSAYLLTSDSATVAFELGAGAFVRLINSADISKLDAIIISHFHFDHCSDVGVLGYYLLRLSAAGKVNLHVKLYCPESDSPLLIAFKNMKAFDVITVGDGQEIRIKDLSLKFYSVNHPVPCLGFTAYDGSRTFAYGGDSNECENLERLVENADLALLDGGFLEKDWTNAKPHLSIIKCAGLAEKYSVKTIISHINPEYDEKDIISEAVSVCDNCLVAGEGESYEV